MPAPLSDDLRSRIVSWSIDDGMSAPDIAHLAHCSERTVHEILRIWREYGELHDPTVRARGRRRALNTGDLDYMTSLIIGNPTHYLDEIQDLLYNNRDIDISIATISRLLRRLNYNHKQVAREALERNELLRATWQGKYGDIPKEYFVWLDESSVHEQTNLRNMG